MFSRGTAEGVSVATAEVIGANFFSPHGVAPGHVEFIRIIKHCKIKQEIKEEQGGGKDKVEHNGGGKRDKKLFVKVNFVGREKKEKLWGEGS